MVETAPTDQEIRKAIIEECAAEASRVLEGSVVESRVASAILSLVDRPSAFHNLPSKASDRAMLRPSNFTELSPAERWQIDKHLGILDWDGRE